MKYINEFYKHTDKSKFGKDIMGYVEDILLPITDENGLKVEIHHNHHKQMIIVIYGYHDDDRHTIFNINDHKDEIERAVEYILNHNYSIHKYINLSIKKTEQGGVSASSFKRDIKYNFNDLFNPIENLSIGLTIIFNFTKHIKLFEELNDSNVGDKSMELMINDILLPLEDGGIEININYCRGVKVNTALDDNNLYLNLTNIDTYINSNEYKDELEMLISYLAPTYKFKDFFGYGVIGKNKLNNYFEFDTIKDLWGKTYVLLEIHFEKIN